MTTSKDSVLAKVRELKKYTCDSDSATTFIEKEAGNCDNCHLNEDGAWCKWHEAQYEKLVSFPSIASYIEEMSAMVTELEADKAKLLADWRRMREVLENEKESFCGSPDCECCRSAKDIANVALSSLSYTDSPTAHE